MSDENRFRVWDNEFKEYVDEKENPFWMKPDGTVIIEYGPQCDDVISGMQYINATDDPNRYVIERCSGMKDITPKLIYSGDIIKSKLFPRETGKVVLFDISTGGFMLLEENAEKWQTPSHFHQAWINEFGYEVVGNVHEVKP